MQCGKDDSIIVIRTPPAPPALTVTQLHGTLPLSRVARACATQLSCVPSTELIGSTQIQLGRVESGELDGLLIGHDLEDVIELGAHLGQDMGRQGPGGCQLCAAAAAAAVPTPIPIPMCPNPNPNVSQSQSQT